MVCSIEDAIKKEGIDAFADSLIKAIEEEDLSTWDRGGSQSCFSFSVTKALVRKFFKVDFADEFALESPQWLAIKDLYYYLLCEPAWKSFNKDEKRTLLKKCMCLDAIIAYI